MYLGTVEYMIMIQLMIAEPWPVYLTQRSTKKQSVIMVRKKIRKEDATKETHQSLIDSRKGHLFPGYESNCYLAVKVDGLPHER